MLSEKLGTPTLCVSFHHSFSPQPQYNLLINYLSILNYTLCRTENQVHASDKQESGNIRKPELKKQKLGFRTYKYVF